MAIDSLPLFADDTSFRYTVTLDDEPYVLEFNYFARPEAWYLNVFDRDENPLRTGVRITINWPLLLRDINPELFTGLLVMLRLDDLGDVDPREEDFGGAVTLLRITDEDLPQPVEEDNPVTIVAL